MSEDERQAILERTKRSGPPDERDKFIENYSVKFGYLAMILFSILMIFIYQIKDYPSGGFYIIIAAAITVQEYCLAYQIWKVKVVRGNFFLYLLIALISTVYAIRGFIFLLLK